MERRILDAFVPTIGVAAIVGIGLTNGGFSAVAWGWIALAFTWTTLGAVFLTEITTTRLALFAVAATATYAAWTALAVLWSPDVTSGAQEAERDLVYVAAVLAAAVIAGRQPIALRTAVLIGTSLLCTYSTVVHLWPDVLGLYSLNTVPGRLFYPLGYWNVQGSLTVISLILLADTVGNGRRPAARALAAAAVPWVAVDCVLTLSRGAELTLLFGVAVWLLVSPRRLRASAWIVALIPAGALAVWRADRTDVLFGRQYSLASSHVGHVLGLEMLLLSAALGIAVWIVASKEHTFVVSRSAQQAYVACLCLFALAAGITAVDRYGAPTSWPKSAYDSFIARPRAYSRPSRLLTFSLNNRNLLWSVAYQQSSEHPVRGAGTGSFATAWYRHRKVILDTSSAHSVYLETLAETGTIGLLLLFAALGAPLLAAVRARHNTYVPALTGAYAASLLHTGADWDWLVPGLTIPALWCGYAILAADPVSAVVSVRGRVRVGIAALSIVIAAVSALALVGNEALARSHDAANRGDYRVAISDARQAKTWQPWSFLPWMEIGSASQALGDRSTATAAFRTATRKAPDRWEPWLALGAVSTGGQRISAIKRAHRLNPLNIAIAELCPNWHTPAGFAGTRKTQALRRACRS